jgi:hypothetical protein
MRPKAKPQKRPSNILYGGPEDETFSATSASEYLRDRYGDANVQTGTVERVAKYRRRRFEPMDFEAAVAAGWQNVVSWLEGEYAIEDDIGLRQLEDKWVRKAARALLRLALARGVRPAQCEQVEVQKWRYDGRRWRRLRGNDALAR